MTYNIHKTLIFSHNEMNEINIPRCYHTKKGFSD